ncbi:FXSXX-COOH protein [Streptomyces hoynatensis]|uniref:FXSXX-COOH protein n=1 Tax=Streptomyces hoynatensis TaxID=1141874 RepID=A0A3A9YX76_9ACTN|nr:FXSXX-COOH protein [Streptomyces hoynatensis]
MRTEEPLPDLLGLSLTELRRLDHPVLSEVLDELRQRVSDGEGLWGGFNQFSQFSSSSLPS